MTVTAQPYRVGEIASNQPNAASAYNLPGSALAHFRTFTSQLSNADVVRVLAYDPSTQGAVNGAWEVTDCTYTTGSPNTLVRTTLAASSTGSKIDWSSEAINPRCVVLGALADEIQILHDNGTSGLTATTLKAAIEELVVDIAAEETARIAADALLLTDPLTTKGDIVIQDTSAAARLAKGTEGQYLVMGGSDLPVWGDGLVINEAGIDVDFRVESAVDDHALFVQGSDGKVGIGESAPLGKLHVKTGDSGGSIFYGADELVLESDGICGLTISTPDDSAGYIMYGDASSTAAAYHVYSHTTDTYEFKIGGSVLHKIQTAETVINGSSLDHDFRVASDTNAHALFVRGSDGHIGIGNSNPLSPLDISIATGDSGGSSGIRMTTVDGGGMSLYPATAVANPVWTFAANSGETFAWRPHGTACMALDYGLTLGAPTGGQKGTGTLNAVSVYDDNTLLTDFVLDQAVDGEIDFEFYDNLELGGAAAREWDPRNLDIDHYEEKWKERKALPSFRSREERFDDDGNEIRDSLGTLVQGLQQELETAMVHIAQLNARLKQLEE